MSPKPLKMPSRITRTAKNGSETATIRNARPPSSTTCRSGVKIDIMGSAKRNRAVLSNVISRVAINIMVEEYCIRCFSFFSPAE